MTGPTATPAMERTIELRDGRILAFCEWGDLDGSPVTLFHGTPGSRLFCPDEDATMAAHVRLITFDRPGYGRSDPHPGRTLHDGVVDFVQLADRLDLSGCPIIGWSGGGPYALACAARFPDRFPLVGLAASPGPTNDVPGGWESYPPEDRVPADLWDRDRSAAIEAIHNLCAWYADDPDASFPEVGPTPTSGDDELLVRPEVLGPLREWMREGARQGSVGFESDWIADLLPWGFSIMDVHADVHVWWGEADPMVSRAHTDYLATMIPGARLVTFPGDGHLFPVRHWREMLDAMG